MQEYRKLLCVNKIRETKRLIENMLIPILSLVVAAAVVGYQIVINFFPIIRKINACNLRICYLVFGFLILYSFGVCFINVKPAIIIKPASLFFIQEKRIRQMISIKYIGLTLKDIIFSIILSACEYSNAIVHAFQGFRAPFSGKIVHIFPEQSAAFN